MSKESAPTLTGLSPGRQFPPTKTEAAYYQIRSWILDGTLKPGSSIDQEAIAAAIGLSTTPVREALRRLETEEFVDVAAHRVATVKPLDAKELDDLNAVRLELEPFAASLSTSRASDEVTALVAELASGEPDSALEQLELNHEFHRTIYANSGNRVLTKILDSVYDRSERYRVLLLEVPGDYLDASVGDHRKLADMFATGDADGMRAMMLAHLTNSVNRLCYRLDVKDALA
jgi:DNA-binding GntR family transcriptional regulator